MNDPTIPRIACCPTCRKDFDGARAWCDVTSGTPRFFCSEPCAAKWSVLHRRDKNPPEMLEPRAGRKDDQGKPRWDLLPGRALEELVLVLTFGANKYAPDGWRLVPNWRSRYAAAALRHFVAWFFKGEARDPESGLHHLAHAACCLFFLLELDTCPNT